jgi:GDP-mannose 6-dehydrogenase
MRESISQVVEGADVIVIGNKSEEFRQIESQVREGQVIIDLVRLFDRPSTADSYEGICW